MSGAAWWTDGIVYQIYPRSFADANGDGIGDLAGMTSRVPYLAELGADAVWVSPWYPSPMVDGGYDVSDYCDIDPDFGTLADADAFVAAAHAAGLKVIIDLVANHCSSAHPWFVAALDAEPGSAERARFHFRDGRGADGSLPPTNWGSFFGGPAWTRVVEKDGRPGQWYLHMFDSGQPDFNWDNAEVAEFFDDVLRFWFDRGIDGFRIDVADSMAKDASMPDTEVDPNGFGTTRMVAGHPWWNQPGLEGIQRRWRAVADSYDPPRMFVSEASSDHKLDYLGPGRLHATFIFDEMWSEWTASSQRHVIERNLAEFQAKGACTTWVLGNHDSPRAATRYGRAVSGLRFEATGTLDDFDWETPELTAPSDVALGRRRARASALLELALPGGAYVYQGEELGLENVDDLPDECLQDPTFARTGGERRGRDGCRVPLPWSGEAPPFGFGPEGSTPWLPQPTRWSALTAQAQLADPASTLNLYRTALRLRRELPALGAGTMTWDDGYDGDHVLAFTREPGFGCVVNFGPQAVALPEGARVLLSSEPLENGLLGADCTAWYALRD